MFESLQDRLDQAFKVFKGEHKISEINVSEAIKEIRRALVDADVHYKIAKEFTQKVKEKALGQEVIKSVRPYDMMVKIVYDELIDLMGRDKAEINLSGSPAVILLSGLQGSGKTTFAAKLANFLRNKKNRKPLLVACDVYRPAAIEQLKVLGEQINIPVYSEEGNKNPVEIAQNAIKFAKTNGFDTVIIDTAGRLAIDQEMMDEISRIKNAIKPSETLFVVDAMTGQDAVNTAKEFNDVLDFDGVVLTKLDGDTRGGAALTIKYVVNKPIKFVGTGEKIDAIDYFYPDRMAERILGMGDIKTLVEKAQESIDEEEAKRLQKKILRDQFDFEDFLKQIRQIKKMGSLKDLISMVPGLGKQVRDMDIDDDSLKHIEAIVLSMTPEERQNPSLLNGSRRKRIALGSGTSVQEVNQLIKQFYEMKKMMKMVTGGGAKQAMKAAKATATMPAIHKKKKKKKKRR